MQDKVEILLATYNGATFLEEQLDALIKQDYPNFSIVVSDDSSTDNTPDIIWKWKEHHPDKISILPKADKQLGATANFSRLIEHSSAPYLAFSDQDDCWLPDKVSKQLLALKALEKQAPDSPAMVFCDLIYCNEKLDVLAPSLIAKDKLRPDLVQANRLLMQNVPYGCASLINQHLAKIAAPIPEGALLHDHWLAISAALCGKIRFQNEALIKHRIHQQNASRAASEHKREAAKDLSSKLTNKNFEHYLAKQIRQAEALKRHYKKQLSEEQEEMLDAFISLGKARGLKRKWIILKYQFLKNTFVNNLKLIARA